MKKNLTVVIVDDSDIVRERLTDMLSGVKAITVIGHARDALEATESIRTLRPDTVILDIRLARGSGIHVLHEIKKYRPAPRVIMLTNYPYPQYRRKCLEAGADFFFDKTEEFEKVADALKELSQNLSPR